jgi:hypothetical protein
MKMPPVSVIVPVSASVKTAGRGMKGTGVGKATDRTGHATTASANVSAKIDLDRRGKNGRPREKGAIARCAKRDVKLPECGKSALQR